MIGEAVLDGGAVALATIGSEIRTFGAAGGMRFHSGDNGSERLNGQSAIQQMGFIATVTPD